MISGKTADMAVIDDAYRRAARIFSPDISRTYTDFLAYKVATPDEPDEFEEAIVEGRVSIAALGLVTEVQAYFDAEADKLAKAWLSKYGSRNQETDRMTGRKPIGRLLR